MRIAIVQFGVLHSRFQALMEGAPETYYAQRYSVQYVADLAARHEFVGVVGVLGDRAESVSLTQTLVSACVPLVSGCVDGRAVIDVLEQWRPDQLILQAPDRRILGWALRRGVDTLPLFADSWEQAGLPSRIRAFLLARQLRHPSIRMIGNHNIPACLSLRRIGAPADKIYPWDWPHELRPESHPAKALSDDPHLVFVGSLTEAKGVGDCIEAARCLCDRGRRFHMTLAGGGDFADRAAETVRALGLEGRVTLAGRLTHDAVIELLRSATVSMAPSWHSYPEGLPMTIYEALATRTPLALSDHPMFSLYFDNADAVRMAPERDGAALADAIDALIGDAEAYAAASAATLPLWNRIKCDLSWGDLIAAWLGEDDASLAALHGRALPDIMKTFA